MQGRFPGGRWRAARRGGFGTFCSGGGSWGRSGLSLPGPRGQGSEPCPLLRGNPVSGTGRGSPAVLELTSRLPHPGAPLPAAQPPIPPGNRPRQPLCPGPLQAAATRPAPAPAAFSVFRNYTRPCGQQHQLQLVPWEAPGPGRLSGSHASRPLLAATREPVPRAQTARPEQGTVGGRAVARGAHSPLLPSWRLPAALTGVSVPTGLEGPPAPVWPGGRGHSAGGRGPRRRERDREGCRVRARQTPSPQRGGAVAGPGPPGTSGDAEDVKKLAGQVMNRPEWPVPCRTAAARGPRDGPPHGALLFLDHEGPALPTGVLCL